jgi:protein-S-isoprenylcysteine O-methyltransferase Ste14
MHVSLRQLALAPWIVIGLVWLAGAPLSKRSVRRESFVQALGYRAPMVLGALAIFSGETRRVAWLGAPILPRGIVLYAIGLAISVVGVAFAIWARLTLGRLWSGTVTLKEGHHLVQSGPYRFARHPIYTGFLFALVGDALLTGTVAAIAGLGLVIFGFILKTGVEERFLEEKFGEEHREYRARVKRLIPFVWLL